MAQRKVIEDEIMSYLQVLSLKKKQTVLSVVKTFAEDEVDPWDEMPATIRKSVKKGLDDLKKSKVVDHSDAMKKIKSKWQKK